MTCAQADELIDAVASGDVVPDAVFAAHIAGCRACAAALQVARGIERALSAAPAMAAPVRFSEDVLARIRRERWRFEERVDRAFNLTIAAGVALVVVALVSLLNLGSLAQMLLVAGETLSHISHETPPWAASGT